MFDRRQQFQNRTSSQHPQASLQLLWAQIPCALGAMCSSLFLGVFVGEHGGQNARDASPDALQTALARSFCQVYWIATLYLSLVALAFMVQSTRFRICPPGAVPGRREDSTTLQSWTASPTRDDIIVLALLCIFLVLQGGNESAYAQLLFTYASVTRGLDFTIMVAAVLCSSFWGCLAFGRLAMLYLAHSFTPQQLLFVFMTCSLTALSLLSSSPHSPPTIWAATLLAGISFGGLVPATFSMCERAFSLSQARYTRTGGFLLCRSSGEMVAPLLLIKLLEPSNDPLHSLSVAVGQLLLLGCCTLLLVAMCYRVSRYQLVGCKDESELTVEPISMNENADAILAEESQVIGPAAIMEHEDHAGTRRLSDPAHRSSDPTWRTIDRPERNLLDGTVTGALLPEYRYEMQWDDIDEEALCL